MIKRYDIKADTVGYNGCILDITENSKYGGEWVYYDDIKHLIPDNRVTEEEIKNAGYDWLGAGCVIKYAKQKGWIKPEGET